MPKDFEFKDIHTLATFAEQGDACPIVEALQDVGFEDRLKTLRLVANESMKDQIENPSVKELTLKIASDEQHIFLSLEEDSQNFFIPNTLRFREAMNFNNGINQTITPKNCDGQSMRRLKNLNSPFLTLD